MVPLYLPARPSATSRRLYSIASERFLVQKCSCRSWRRNSTLSPVLLMIISFCSILEKAIYKFRQIGLVNTCVVTVLLDALNQLLEVSNVNAC